MGTNDYGEGTAPKQDLQALISAARKWGESELLELGEVDGETAKVLVTPSGRSAQTIKHLLDEYRDAPERKTGTAELTTLDSFCDHVKRTKDKDSLIFANDDRERPYMLAVYDYNKSSGEARFQQHRAIYKFPVSDEWKAWTNAGEMPQEAFAAFIEDRILDVMDPVKAGDTMKEFAINLSIELAGAQKIMQLSRGLAVNVGQKVVKAVNLTSGEGQIVFTEEHKDEGGAPLKVPGGFVIAIPVFRSGDVFQIGVRLRYRVRGATITWRTELFNVDRVFETAVGDAVEKTKKSTELPVMFGTPEK